MDDDDKDGDNDNRKNNVVDNGDENEDEDKLNVSLGFLPFLTCSCAKPSYEKGR